MKNFFARAGVVSLFVAGAIGATSVAHADPFFQPLHPIFLPNPHNYLLLSQTHYVSTELGVYSPQSTSLPTKCAWYGTFFCMADKGAPFSADFGDGVDINSAVMVWLDESKDATNTINPGRIAFVDHQRQAGTPLMHLTGFVENAPTNQAPPKDGLVEVRATVGFGNGKQVVPADWLELAIQTQDAGDQWHDAPYVVRSSYIDDTQRPVYQSPHNMTAYARVPPFTAVRMEVRGGGAAAAHDEGVRLSGGQLLVTVCTPDTANPGVCL